MPNASHFGWGKSTHGGHLALPRPSSSPAAGAYVQLTAAAALNGPVDGPLAAGDVGIVIEDTGSGSHPYLVQELVSGRLWWYPEGVLCRVQPDQVAHDLLHPPHPGEGSYVTLMAEYRSYSDAGRGPLSLFMRNEDAYGIVLMESGQRFRVRSCYTGRDWWYDHGAVRPVHMRYVPESLRAAVRPAWGDYVALTGDHAEFSTAADGPLEPGNLGVVVAVVSDAADSDGGLQQPRYLVRACHNGQCFRYLEGALHLVVQQLLHSPKIPPATAKRRRRKLMCELTLLDAATAAAAASTAAGRGTSSAAVATGSVLNRGQLQQVHQVVPGQRYLIAAKLSCKDDDLMLANLRVCSFDLYAPSGRPGHYIQLQPVQPDQQQQLSWGGARQPRGQRQQSVSLAVCNSSHSSSVASSTSSGTCAWYDPVDDFVTCVFAWDSSETPLVLKPHRVTGVQFLWGVSFSELDGQQTKHHTLYLQTAGAATVQQQQMHRYSSSSSNPVAAGSAAGATQLAAAAARGGIAAPGAASAGHVIERSDSSTHSVVFEWLDAADGDRSRRTAGSSSSSSSTSDDEDDGDEDTVPGQQSDSEDGSNNGNSSSESGETGSVDEQDDDEEEDSDSNSNEAADGATSQQQDSFRGNGREDDGNGGGSGGSNSGGAGHGGPSSGSSSGGGGGSGGPGSDTAGGSAPPTPPAGASAGASVDAAASLAAEATPTAAADEQIAGAASHGGGSSSSSRYHALSLSVVAAAGYLSAAGVREAHATGSSSAGSSSSSNNSRGGGYGAATAAVLGSSRPGDDPGSSRCPNTPDLALGCPAAAGSSSSYVASTSSRPSTGSSSSRSMLATTSSGSGSSPDAYHGTRLDQGAPSASMLHAGSSSSSSSFRFQPSSSRGLAAAATQVRHSSAGPVVSVPGAQGSILGGVSIQEIMRQVQLQAESREPMWQQGTELAASLAAKAMAAAEEWQQNWQRPQ